MAEIIPSKEVRLTIRVTPEFAIKLHNIDYYEKANTSSGKKIGIANFKENTPINIPIIYNHETKEYKYNIGTTPIEFTGTDINDYRRTILVQLTSTSVGKLVVNISIYTSEQNIIKSGDLGNNVENNLSTIITAAINEYYNKSNSTQGGSKPPIQPLQKTNRKVQIKNQSRVVYLNKYNTEYIKYKGEFLPLKKAMRLETAKPKSKP